MYIGCLQAHEKMFNFATHWINANQDLTSVRMNIVQKTTLNKFWQGCGERKPLYTVGGNVNWYSQFIVETVWRFL